MLVKDLVKVLKEIPGNCKVKLQYDTDSYPLEIKNVSYYDKNNGIDLKTGMDLANTVIIKGANLEI